MLKDILFALWFLLPAAIANMVPILAAAAPGLKNWEYPLDAGLTFRGKPLFGAHKTWRGIISGTLAGWLIYLLQKLVWEHWSAVHVFTPGLNYAQLPLLLGLGLSFGALAGDALKSFFKRQFNVVSGKSWMPFDQLDYIIGAVLLSLPFIALTWAQYVWIFVIWFGMHLLFTYIGWRLGLKAQPI